MSIIRRSAGRRVHGVDSILLPTAGMCAEAPRRVASLLIAVGAILAPAPGGIAGQVPEGVGAERITEATPVLAALGDYVGRWRSEEKTARDGRTYRFGYQVRWYDQAHTIVQIRVDQLWPDGSSDLLWDGFKGRAGDGVEVYYWGASPSGRSARGRLYLEGDRLITAYDAWSVDGSAVRVRDVFTPVEDGRFIGRTWLRAEGETDWRQVGEDRWERVG